MYAEHAISVLVPVLILAVLWTVVRHWILPFVLGFAVAVALGPSARPLLASAWEAVTDVGGSFFGRPRDGMADPPEIYPGRRRHAPGGYDDR
jgi:hypothetical protein